MAIAGQSFASIARRARPGSARWTCSAPHGVYFGELEQWHFANLVTDDEKEECTFQCRPDVRGTLPRARTISKAPHPDRLGSHEPGSPAPARSGSRGEPAGCTNMGHAEVARCAGSLEGSSALEFQKPERNGNEEKTQESQTHQQTAQRQATDRAPADRAQAPELEETQHPPPHPENYFPDSSDESPGAQGWILAEKDLQPKNPN